MLGLGYRLRYRLGYGGVLVAPVGLGRELPLRREALQVAHEAQAQRILDVEALAADQVPGDLRRALPEADAVVVHRVALGIVRVRVETWKQ